MATEKYHLLGVGGIGVSALARWLNARGFRVSGADTTPSDLTAELAKEGILITEYEDTTQVPGCTAVIYTSAIHNEHPALSKARALDIPCIRRADFLGQVASHGKQVGIAGSHGKTTTTAMTAKIWQTAGLAPTAFVGGEVLDFGGNLLLGQDDWFILEADEYDRSFLTLRPNLAAITAIDPDHLDIYGTPQAYRKAFSQYLSLQPDCTAIICLDDPGCRTFIPPSGIKLLTVGRYPEANLRADSIEFAEFSSSFDLLLNKQNLGRIILPMPGEHNISNALVAAGLALEAGISFDTIQKALAGFKGVKRRFEFLGKHQDMLFYDDYAHHPGEVEATLKAIRRQTNRRLIAAFQPHLFTRTRDFYKELAGALTIADMALVLPIYPAREEPIEGVTSALIVGEMKKVGFSCEKSLLKSKQDLYSVLDETLRDGDLFITLGAGSITGYGREYLKKLEEKEKSV